MSRQNSIEEAKSVTDAAALIKTTAEQTAVALNIQYIQKDIVEIKQTLREVSGNFVTKPEFTAHLLKDEDHEKRIRAIEQNMWKWLGALAGISALVGYAMKLINF